MQGACEKSLLSLHRGDPGIFIFVFDIFDRFSFRQVASTRWTCSSLVVNQRFDWRQEVDHNRPIGACREHGLANAPQ
jgi:hypothetical protein